MREQVVIGLFGSSLDRGGRKRWQRWRPTLSLLNHEDFLVNRLELLVDEHAMDEAGRMVVDAAVVSPETAVRLHPVHFNNPWDLGEVYGTLQDFATDYPFEPEQEDYLVHITTGTHVCQIVLFLLTEAGYFPGKLLQASPPEDRASAEPGSIHIIDLDLSKYDRLATRFEKEAMEGLAFLKSGIDTRNAAFNQIMAQIEQVAIASRAPILLMGPTGAGKSRLAKRIYALKQQRKQVDGRFVAVNCATLRGDAAMATLFGHTRGAFTGAMRERPGLLRAADGGVLFLDEIGTLGADEQAMLLQALEDKRFMPVGSDQDVHSDFQLIAGTNAALWEQVQAGTFREDLLARINLWTYHLPPLRERKEDLEPNIAYELDQLEREQQRRISFNREAFSRFLQFAKGPQGLWRANFRDLNACLTRMATLAPGGRIRLEDVEAEINRLTRQWHQASHQSHETVDLNTYFDPQQLAAIDLFDQAQLNTVLAVCARCRTLAEAGRELFAASRLKKRQANDSDRLRKYLAKFDLEPTAVLNGRV